MSITSPITNLTMGSIDDMSFAPAQGNCAQCQRDPACLHMGHVLVAVPIVLIIFSIIVGNLLVLLSIALHKRMRTFTNFLLASLSTADLMVGLLVTPLSLLDLLSAHIWPLGRRLCSLWATADVLLCTASILNLVVISLDRYFAITYPLKYSRRRTRRLVVTLIVSVWVVSMLICTPPLLIPEWALFSQSVLQNPPGSFYIPLIVMVFVYAKIFKVANEREKMLRQSGGIGSNLAPRTMRLSMRKAATSACTSPMTSVRKGSKLRTGRNLFAKKQTNVRIQDQQCYSESVTLQLRSNKNIYGSGVTVTRAKATEMEKSGLTVRTPNQQLKPVDSVTKMVNSQSTSVALRRSTLQDAAPHSERVKCSVTKQGNDLTRPRIVSTDDSSSVQMGSGVITADDLSTVPTLAMNPNHVTHMSSQQDENTKCHVKVPNLTAPSTPRLRPQQISKPRDCRVQHQSSLTSADGPIISPMLHPGYNQSLSQDCPQPTSSEGRNLACSVPNRLNVPGGLRQDSLASAGDCDAFDEDSESVVDMDSCFAKSISQSDTENSTKSAQTEMPKLVKRAKKTYDKTQPTNLLKMTNKIVNKPDKRKNEKAVYVRERKALKTIGIIVFGFIVSWLPFFILYVIEVSPLISQQVPNHWLWPLAFDACLWLGYSNSALNPVIYAFCNDDFRRCFRRLATCRCWRGAQDDRRRSLLRKARQHMHAAQSERLVSMNTTHMAANYVAHTAPNTMAGASLALGTRPRVPSIIDTEFIAGEGVSKNVISGEQSTGGNLAVARARRKDLVKAEQNVQSQQLLLLQDNIPLHI